MAAPAMSRVDVTGEAADLLRRLTAEHGSLMFHQSGCCCDGSSPMCFPLGEFITGDSDVPLGDLAIDGIVPDVPVWMSTSQFEYWQHTHLTIDVVKGRGAGFSLEVPAGVRFLIGHRHAPRAHRSFGTTTLAAHYSDRHDRLLGTSEER